MARASNEVRGKAKIRPAKDGRNLANQLLKEITIAEINVFNINIEFMFYRPT